MVFFSWIVLKNQQQRCFDCLGTYRVPVTFEAEWMNRAVPGIFIADKNGSHGMPEFVTSRPRKAGHGNRNIRSQKLSDTRRHLPRRSGRHGAVLFQHFFHLCPDTPIH